MKNIFLSFILGIAIMAQPAHARTYNGQIFWNDLQYSAVSLLTDIVAFYGANAVTAWLGLPSGVGRFLLKPVLFLKTWRDLDYFIDEARNLSKPMSWV